MAVVVTGEDPVLYVCPYCVKGRFTAKDGWATAVKHIREKHQDGKRVSLRRGRRPSHCRLDDESLLEET